MQTIASAVAAVVHEAFAQFNAPLGPQGPQGPRGTDGIPASSVSLKSDDVGYFTPEPTSDRYVKTERGVTIYLNVYAFINQLKALVPLKTEAVVRSYIPLCLRGAASHWYTTELSDVEREDLNIQPLVTGWYDLLERRFKMRASIAQ